MDDEPSESSVLGRLGAGGDLEIDVFSGNVGVRCRSSQPTKSRNGLRVFRPWRRDGCPWGVRNGMLPHHCHSGNGESRQACNSICSACSEGDVFERNHPRRRQRHPAISGHSGDQQAIAARVRQADDLLPAFGPDAGRNPGNSDHFHAPGPSPFPGPPG